MHTYNPVYRKNTQVLFLDRPGVWQHLSIPSAHIFFYIHLCVSVLPVPFSTLDSFFTCTCYACTCIKHMQGTFTFCCALSLSLISHRIFTSFSALPLCLSLSLSLSLSLAFCCSLYKDRYIYRSRDKSQSHLIQPRILAHSA